METNASTITVFKSSTSFFKLQTSRTCQQWPQGNDKTAYVSFIGWSKRKSHAMFSACQLGPRAMPQSHCERPCVPAQGLLVLYRALNSAVGRGTGAAFSYSCGRRYARHMLLSLRSGTLTVWKLSVLVSDYKCGSNGGDFLNLSTDNWVEPRRKRREKRREKHIRRRKERNLSK